MALSVAGMKVSLTSVSWFEKDLDARSEACCLDWAFDLYIGPADGDIATCFERVIDVFCQIRKNTFNHYNC